MSLAGETTVMCCPEGKECDGLDPITCNIRAQDAEKDHTLPLKTTVFDVELAKCGDNGCCPFGFTCADGDDGKECKKDKDQSKRPGEDDDKNDDPESTTTSSSATSDPTSDPSANPSSTTDAEPTATGDESNSDDSSSGNSGPDTTSIIGGVVGACAVLLIVAVVLFVCVRKRAKRRPAGGTPPPPKPPTTQVLHGRNISGPTNVEGNPDFGRCEFLQKRDTEPGEGLDDDSDGLGVMYNQNDRQSRLGRLSTRFSRARSDRDSTRFPFGSSSPNPSLPETPLDQIPSNEYVRRGNVNSISVPPIRSMKPTIRTKSRHLHPEMARDIPRQLTPRPPRPPRAEDDAASDTIPIMTDPQQSLHETGGETSRLRSGVNRRSQERVTQFSDIMTQAGMEGVGESKTFVPWVGATPRV